MILRFLCPVLLGTSLAQAAQLSDDVPMAQVPEGSFQMGRLDPAHGGDGLSDEYPLHSVYLNTFWIDQFPVTNRQYQRCVSAGLCEAPQSVSAGGREHYFDDPGYADFPVVYVSWEQAEQYCHWVGKVLPTEAQWEKAAVGDRPKDYPWGNEIDDSYANYHSGTGLARKKQLSRVGAYLKNVSAYGVYDMAGNVLQWARDWYDDEFYQHSPAQNPWQSSAVTLSNGWQGALKETLWDLSAFLPSARHRIAVSELAMKVLRGGAAYDSATLLKSSRRFPLWTGAKAARAYTGFRCARED